MRKIARFYSSFLAVGFAISLVLLIRGLLTGGHVDIFRFVIVTIATAPFVLVTIVLGTSKHRWERYALYYNQVIAVVSALALAWADMTTADQWTGSLASMLLIGSALNWAAIVENERTKVLVLSGFGIWAFAFFLLGAATGSVSNRTVAAAAAGANRLVSIIFIIFIVVVIGLFPTIMELIRKPKNDPLSLAHREGDLAFRNELGEDTNPYAGRDQKLEKSWLAGFRKASEVSKHRVVPK